MEVPHKKCDTYSFHYNYLFYSQIWEEIKDDPKKTARFAVIAEDKPEIDQFKV